MNSSTLFFYFNKTQECFAVESRSSGYSKDKSKKFYHLKPNDEAARKLMEYVKFKNWTEYISEKNTPKIILIGDPNSSHFFRLEYEGYQVDFTPDKFAEEPNKENTMNYTAEHKGFTLNINEVLDAQQNPIYFEGECKEINFSVKGFHKEYQHSMQGFFKLVYKFKDEVDKLTEEKQEDKVLNQLHKQLDRLRERDKEINYPPFELRGELISIHHLFSGITELTLEDVKRIYFERAESNQ